jgi:hypothetical protein
MKLVELLGDRLVRRACGCWVVLDDDYCLMTTDGESPRIKLDGRRVSVRKVILLEDLRLENMHGKVVERRPECTTPHCVNPDHFDLKAPGNQTNHHYPKIKSKRWSPERRQRHLAQRGVVV